MVFTKKRILTVVLLTGCLSLVGQNSVGVNTNSPNVNAVLELVSPNSNQGFLVPRLTTFERTAMASGLSDAENGLMVFDTDENIFYFWETGSWNRGLGALDGTVAGGDLAGFYPNPVVRIGAIGETKLADQAVSTIKIRDLAVTTAKLADNAVTTPKIADDAVTGSKLEDTGVIPGIYGDQFLTLQLTLDAKGRVLAISELPILITSANITNLTILDEDIANGTITISKIDPEGNTDKVLVIDGSGSVRWEDRSEFTSSDLTLNSLYIGDATNKAVGLPAVGDISFTNTGTDINTTIQDNAVQGDDLDVTNADFTVPGTQKIILNNTGGLEVNNAVDVNSTIDVSGNANYQQDVDIDGNLSFDGVAPQVSRISTDLTTQNLTSDLATADAIKTYVDDEIDADNDLLRGNVFVGDALDEAAQLDASGDGFVLVGDGNDLNSVDVSGDVEIANDGTTTIQPDAVTTGKILNDNITGEKLAPAVAGNGLIQDGSGNLDLNIAPTGGLEVSGDQLRLAIVPNQDEILIGSGSSDFVNGVVSGDVTITESGGVITSTIQDDAVDGGDLDLTSGNFVVTGANQFQLNNSGGLLVAEQADFTENVDANNGLDVTGADLTVGGTNFSVDPATGDVGTSGSIDITTNLSFDAGNTANEIVTDLEVDLGSPSDNALVTETALASSIGNQAGSGLTYDGTGNEIDLGGDLQVDAIIGTAGSNFSVESNDTGAGTSYLEVADGGDITIGDGTIQTGAGQVDFNGNVDANGGLDVTGADLTVGGTNFTVDNTGNVVAGGTLDADGTVNLSSTGALTTVEGTLLVAEQADFTENVDANNGLDVTGADLTVGGTNFSVDPATGDVGTSGSIDITTNLSFDAGNTANEIVTDLEVDLGSPSDNALVTETALASSIGNQAGSGLTYDGTGNEIDLGGDLQVDAIIGTAGSNFSVESNDTGAGTSYLEVADGGNITIGDGTIQTGAGQVDFNGNVDANGGLDVTGADLTVGGTNFTVDNTGNVVAGGTLDADGTVNLSSTGALTTVEGTLLVAEQADFTENVDANNGLDVTGADLTVGGTNFSVDPATGDVGTSGSIDITTNLSFDAGNTANEIVTDLEVDLGSPSDNALVTETALASSIGNQAGSGLTYDGTGNEIDLGGDLQVDAIIGTAGSNFSVESNDTGAGTSYLEVADGGDITIGDGTIQTGAGQVDFNGNVDANGGLDVTGADLTVGGTNFTVDNTGNVVAGGTLDADGTVNLSSTGALTTVEGTLLVAEQADFTENVDANNGLDVTGADLTVGGTNFSVDPATGDVGTSGSIDITTNLSFDAGNTANEIVTDLEVDLGSPSDNALVTETALASSIGNQAGSGLTYDGTGNEIDLGGDLQVDAIIGTAGSNFSVESNDTGAGTSYLEVADGGNITIGDGTIQTGAGQVDFNGNVDANGGLDVTGADLTVGGTNFTVDNTGNVVAGGTLDADGTVNLSSTGALTTVEGTLLVAEQADFTENVDANNGLDVTGADLTVGGTNFSVDPATGDVGTSGSIDITTNLSFDAGNTANEIVTDLEVDLGSPSDNALVTETALASSIGNQAGSGLTYDGTGNEIDLGGDLQVDAIIGTAGSNFSVESNDTGAGTSYLEVADGGNITIGDGTIQTGAGQVDFNGNVDANGGLDVTGADLTVGGTNFTVDNTGNVVAGGTLGVTGITTLNAANGIQFGAGQNIKEFSTDVNLTDNSNEAIPTEQAVKTYVDTEVTNKDLQSAYEAGPDITTNATGPLQVSGDQRIVLTTTETSTNAIQITASNGDLDIDGTDVTIDATTGGMSIGSTEDSDISLVASDPTNQTLSISSTNGGAGNGNIDLSADGTIGITSADDQTLSLGANDSNDKQLLISATNAGSGLSNIQMQADGDITIGAVGDINITDDLNASNLIVAGTADLNGPINLGNESTDPIGITGGITFNEPTNNLVFDVTDQSAAGGILRVPNIAGADETILTNADIGTIASQDDNAVDINGGNIDNTVIGGTTSAAGTFTDLTATGTVALGTDAIETGEITDGTIGNIDINASAAIAATKLADGSIDNTEFQNLDGLNQTLASTDNVTFNDATLNGTVTLGSDNADAVNVPGVATFNEDIILDDGSNDVTMQLTTQTTGPGTLVIPDLAGATETILTNADIGTIASQDDNAVDINGGTIDNTAIGAAVRSTARFTDLDANGTVTLGTDAIETGEITDGTIGNIDINASAAIAATKLADGSIDNTEFQNLDGLNQTLASTDNVTFNDATLNGTVTLGSDNADAVNVPGVATFNEDIILDDGSNDVTMQLTTQTTGPGTLVIPDLAGATETILTNADIGTIASQDDNAVDINGGTIDNTAIGATTRSTARFTDLDANGTVTLGTDAIETGEITDGTIGNIDINASAAIAATKLADGSIDNTEFQNLDGLNQTLASTDNVTFNDATLNGTVTLGSDNADAVNVPGVATFNEDIILDDGSNDVTMQLTTQTTGPGTLVIPDLAGATETILTNADIGTIASQDDNAVDINGGNIDNTVIGGTTSAAGTFTDLTATGTVALGTDAIETGEITDGTIGNIDINASAAIAATKLADGSIDNTEFQNLDGLNQTLASTDNVTFNDATLNGTVTLGSDNADAVNVPGVATFNEDIILDDGSNDVTMQLTTQTTGPGTLVIPDLAGATETILTNADIGTIASQDDNAVDINGGNIDNTVIGGTTSAAGTFTDLTATGTVALGTDAIETGEITDGTIGNIDINASAAIAATKLADGSIDNTEFQNLDGLNQTLASTDNVTFNDATLNGTVTLGSDNADAVNVPGVATFNEDIILDDGSNDVTMQLTTQTTGPGTLVIPDLAGATETILTNADIGTIASQDDNAVDINGGNIDNTVIGGTTSAAGTFTDLTATGTVALGTDAIETGEITDGTIGNIDINASAAIAATKLADGSIDNTEFQNLDGLNQTLASTDNVTFNDATLNGTVTLGSDNADAVNVPGVATFNEDIILDDGSNDVTMQLTTQTTGPGTLVIPDLAGATETILTNADIGTIASQDDNAVDINGGTIDNTAIGATTRSTARFTDLDANGTVTLGTDAIETGEITDGTIGNIDINASAAIAATKLADGSIDNTEFQNLDGLDQELTTTSDVTFNSLTLTSLASGGDDRTYNADVGTASLTISAAGLFGTSDRRLKENITLLQNTLEKLNQLGGYNYNYKADEAKKKQIGVIAQELEMVFPELVTTDERGFKMVNYQGLVPVLIEAIKEQQLEIKLLSEKLENQESKLSELSSENESMRKDIDYIKKMIGGGKAADK